MHEMSFTQSIVQICEENSAGRKVTSVTLEIGALSGVVADAVKFCFEACSSDTCLQGARLIIEQPEAIGLCRECQRESAINAYYDPCPLCGGLGLEILAGEELRVKEIEVE